MATYIGSGRLFTTPPGIGGAYNTSSQLARTSTGKLYAFFTSASTTGPIRAFRSTNNGSSWSLIPDYENTPTGTIGSTAVSLAVAVDGNDNIHLVYQNNLSTVSIGHLVYNTTTETYGSPQYISYATGGAVYGLSVAIDGSNFVHIAACINSGSPKYTNNVGGYFKTPINITATDTLIDLEILIDQNNTPQIGAFDLTNGVIAYIGNKNDSTSFTRNAIVTTAGVNTISSTATGIAIGLDSSFNTWVAWQAARNGPVVLAKHVKTDPWSTWQPVVSDGFTGSSPSMAIDGTDIYLFYERNVGGIAYDKYDSINQKWLGEQVIQANTPRSGTNVKFHNPSVKWSNYFDNGLTAANNQNQNIIEYLFDNDNSTAASQVYYDKLNTAQISTGIVSFSFSPAQQATTTSTSSTSSSTSTSTSTSTSSTSTSTSTSISSTSSSISTSTSTSSTSQSTSTSVSTSTSSTSASTSISTSTSSTSTSTSHSTSSTSTSTSVSTTSQSTSTSLSTSSTSTSTSSTSTSTTQSFTTSTSSTSASTSISSTSQSTSTSLSTSTSSTSTSFSTSSTSTSTTQSFTTSTSSTSTSTSTSSTSTSQSTSTSSTSQSTSTSSTSTSQSTSSTSTSTSTSSTSTSTSFSTSSTSQSTSTSHSTTSQSTSTSLSTSSTSTSTSLSTSSTSTSTTASFTTSTSSTSTSTSSTSTSTSSTSTSTTTIAGLDVGFLPRATIYNSNARVTVYPELNRVKIRPRLD